MTANSTPESFDAVVAEILVLLPNGVYEAGREVLTRLAAAHARELAEHGAALAQALENDARWRSFRKTISIHADDMTPERWDKREDSFMADYADAYDPAAIAAQQKEAANGD